MSSSPPPDPADDQGIPEQPAQPGHVSARVPSSVRAGAFATGVIIMTGPTEFALDFVQGLVQPPALVARVFMPHGVLPQFAAALKDNLGKYEQRFGTVPNVSRPANPKTSTPLQQVYDDLRIDDEVLRGSYANAVMINHGAAEFKLDFLANAAPRSAVTSRVFLTATQVAQLLGSLERTWNQFQERIRQQQPPQDQPDDDNEEQDA